MFSGEIISKIATDCGPNHPTIKLYNRSTKKPYSSNCSADWPWNVSDYRFWSAARIVSERVYVSCLWWKKRREGGVSVLLVTQVVFSPYRDHGRSHTVTVTLLPQVNFEQILTSLSRLSSISNSFERHSIAYRWSVILHYIIHSIGLHCKHHCS